MKAAVQNARKEVNISCDNLQIDRNIKHYITLKYYDGFLV